MKFGKEVKCVKVHVCVYANCLKGASQWEWPIIKRCMTFKCIHRLTHDFLKGWS